MQSSCARTNVQATSSGRVASVRSSRATNALTPKHGLVQALPVRSSRAISGSGRRSVQVQAFFDFLKKKEPAPAAEPPRPKRPTVIPEPSFNIPAVLLSLAGLSAFEGWTPAAGLFGLLGVFLGVQATRVRFVFFDDALEVRIGDQLNESENAFVGGANRWAYDSFVNWEFWWPGFPVLVYFKETQTKPEGQIHFFPIIFDGRQLYDVMAERCGPSQNSGPK